MQKSLGFLLLAQSHFVSLAKMKFIAATINLAASSGEVPINRAISNAILVVKSACFDVRHILILYLSRLSPRPRRSMHATKIHRAGRGTF